jgi:hypothetical protein
MRFLRALFHNLLNNEKLINNLAESRPVRQSAQFVVHLLIKAGMLDGTRSIFSSRQQFVKQLRDIAQRLRQQLEDSKDEFKKNTPK